MTQEDKIDVDWKRVFGFLLMLAGTAGSLVALLYIWFIQMMLRYGRDSLWEGFWFFAVCGACLLVSILVGSIGLRMYRSRNG
ncbi:MAG: hypothetical protein WCC66_06460 [Rhizobiaceae bacterium]